MLPTRRYSFIRQDRIVRDATATKEALLGLMAQLDIHAEGSVAVFYGGKV
jgi:hypothetical protein